MASVLKVAVLRGHDLEARELVMFDRLREMGLVEVHAIGDRPLTPYGLGGVAMGIRRTSSASSLLCRLPLGRTMVGRIQSRTGVSLARPLGLGRAVGCVDVINTRETVSAQSGRAIRLSYASPQMRIVVSCFENIAFRYEEATAERATKVMVRERADLFVANSPEAAEALRLEGVPEDRVRMVMPGVDTDYFSPGEPDAHLRALWGAGPQDVVVLYTGRLLAEKGLVELLVAARPVLSARDTRVRVVFHGAGPERPRLESAIVALGLSDRVAFSPWAPITQMPDVYRSADLVVLPSLSAPYWTEQFGYTLVEAMSCGRSVLATSSGSIPSVVADAAELVPERSPDDLTQAIAALIESPQRRGELAERGRRRALVEFSVEVAGRRTLAAFEAALAMAPRQVAMEPPRSDRLRWR